MEKNTDTPGFVHKTWSVQWSDVNGSLKSMTTWDRLTINEGNWCFVYKSNTMLVFSLF